MIKRILICVVLLLLSAYMVIAVTAFNRKPENRICEGVELVVKDKVDYGFITENGIKSLLKREKIAPEGKRLADVNVRILEEVLSRHPFIREAECYLTSGGKVGIEIYQRIPLLRVLSNNGDNYYIDNQGMVMSAPGKAIHVAVATGALDR